MTVVGVVLALTICSIAIAITTFSQSPEENNEDAPIIQPIIHTKPSHQLGNYKLNVVGISYDGRYEYWVGIDNVTYLLTDYVINPDWYVVGPSEPAQSILNDQNNESNLASGRVREIKNKFTSSIIYYDNDNNDLITIGDEFIINSNIIPINAINGVDLYLIYEGDYYKDQPIFTVMDRVNIGRYYNRLQFSIERENDIYNVTILRL